MVDKLIILIIFLLVCLILSIRHCYLKRGARLTFTFYFFSFLYISRWVLKNISDTPSFLKTARELTMDRLFMSFSPVLNTTLIAIISILGWMFLFYIGWFMAEKIMQRFDILRRRLFPTLLLSSLATVSILYPIEAMGSNVGWWRWQLSNAQYDIFFISCPVHPLREGFYFTLYFLAAYFLIECSKFNYSDWKMIFFILPFIHFWTIRFFGNGLPRFFERLGVLAIMIVLTFLSPLKLEDAKPGDLTKVKIIDRGLSIIIILILFLLCLEDIFIINKPLLVLSVLPALFFYLFSIKKIWFTSILLLGCLIFFIDKATAILLMIPLSVFLAFRISNQSEKEMIR